jgi:hypothetical protein
MISKIYDTPLCSNTVFLPNFKVVRTIHSWFWSGSQAGHFCSITFVTWQHKQSLKNLRVDFCCTDVWYDREVYVSLYRGDEFSILRLFVSLKFPFTTKNVYEFQCSVRIYVRYISQKHEIFWCWPNKSHDVTIETPTNHSSSRRDIVFHSLEKNVGIVRRFVISNSVEITISRPSLRWIFRLQDSVHDPPTLIPFESWDSQLSSFVITLWCRIGEFVN